MRRAILYCLFALALLMSAATAALWIRSYWYADRLSWSDGATHLWPPGAVEPPAQAALTPEQRRIIGGLPQWSVQLGTTYALVSHRGRLFWYANYEEISDRGFARIAELSQDEWFVPFEVFPKADFTKDFFVLRYDSYFGKPTWGSMLDPAGAHSMIIQRAVSVPSWIVVVLPLMLAVWIVRPIRRWRRRRQAQEGLCPGCGYNLHAHALGQKCPECGRTVGARAG